MVHSVRVLALGRTCVGSYLEFRCVFRMTPDLSSMYLVYIVCVLVSECCECVRVCASCSSQLIHCTEQPVALSGRGVHKELGLPHQTCTSFFQLTRVC
ncbi:unnamed protein product [Gadus morhua 'NCC']